MNDLSRGRYVLFCCKHYYPSGGWSDATNRSDDKDALIEIGSKYAAPGRRDPDEPFAQVVDLETGEIAWES